MLRAPVLAACFMACTVSALSGQSKASVFLRAQAGPAFVSELFPGPLEDTHGTWGAQAGLALGVRFFSVLELDVLGSQVLGAERDFRSITGGLGVRTPGRNQFVARVGFGAVRTEVIRFCPGNDSPCPPSPDRPSQAGLALRAGYQLVVGPEWSAGVTLDRQFPFHGEYHQRASALILHLQWR
jgi:hypothetical protein